MTPIIPHFHIHAGIGDSAWMFQKLQGQFPTFDMTVTDYGYRRSKECLELLGVRNIYYSKKYKPDDIYRITHPHTVDLNALDYSIAQPLEVNGWMEKGHRIEEWLPQYPTKYQLDFQTTDEQKEKASKYLNKYDGGKKIIFYTSNKHNNSANNFFSPRDWVELAKQVRTLYGDDTTFIIVGAEYDRDCTSEVVLMMMQEGIRYVDTVGCHIGITIEMIRAAHGCIAYPSGIGIMANFVGTPVVMGMFIHIKYMHYRWVDPKLIGTEVKHFCLTRKNELMDHIKSWEIR